MSRPPTGSDARTTRRGALAAAGAGLAAIAGCRGNLPGRERVRRETVRARTDRPLVVDTPSGDVAVIGEDRDDVRIETARRTRYGASRLGRIDVSARSEGTAGSDGAAYVVRATGGSLRELRAAVDVHVRLCGGDVAAHRACEHPREEKRR